MYGGGDEGRSSVFAKLLVMFSSPVASAVNEDKFSARFGCRRENDISGKRKSI